MGYEYKTVVYLKQPLEEYKEGLRKRADTIARQIIEHTLVSFANNAVPEIIVIDGEEALSLNSLFADEIGQTTEEYDFEVSGQKFSQKLLKAKLTPKDTHMIYLCANGREVVGIRAEREVPSLRKKITDEDTKEEFYVIACVTGDYLDANVNEERTGFKFSRDGDLDIVTDKRIFEQVANGIRRYAGTYIQQMNADANKRLRDYIETKSPVYRFMLKPEYEAYLEKVDPTLSEAEIETKLHSIKFELEQEVRSELKDILEPKPESIRDAEEYRNRLEAFLERENEIGKADLAKYVAHRRVILDLLEKSLKLRADGKYPLEEDIHRIIHPLRTVSDDVDFYDQNLWIIDERLTYHRFLASDKPFTSMPIVDSRSTREADILAYFDNAIAFADSKTNYQSFVIVEFKHPGRDDYRDGIKHNPLDQISEYVSLIRNGEAKDFNQRPISNKDVPIYSFIICDITPSIRPLLSRRNYRMMFDGQGFYHFNDELKYYSEVISYDKLLENAQKRNKVLFEKLGLPTN